MAHRALAQIRREKFAFFEKHCSEVAERIFLSGDAVARSWALLSEHGITHVLNAVGAQKWHQIIHCLIKI